ncbi:hypothetical protein RI129_007822 [Pyrocoelia pectoralis]|uniref:Retrotransposon gag domain-containing protein n=1 Tax=Pyrocoelia pectoralis TaxID=417401 RepID=A0AAN7ZIE6_9COLE
METTAAAPDASLDTEPKSSGSQQQLDPVSMLVAAIEQMKPSQPELLPTFSGDQLEDPEKFFVTLEEASVTKDATEQLKTAIKQLRGDAAKWWKGFEGFQPTYQELKAETLDRYDNERVKGKLAAEFFGRDQKSENARTFLQRKAHLATRLKLPIADHTELLKELMNPRIRRFLHTTTTGSILELVRISEKIENDHKAMPQGQDEATTREPNLPKCRFCPGYHFHRDCPTLLERHGNQGNGPAAGHPDRPHN